MKKSLIALLLFPSFVFADSSLIGGTGGGGSAGGGSTNGSIVASPTNQVPRYSGAGSTTTLTGAANLTNDGTTVAVIGSGGLTTTFGVSAGSITVSTNSTIAGSTFTFQNNGLLKIGQINWFDGTIQVSSPSASGSNLLPSTNTWTGGNTHTSSTTFNGAVVISTSINAGGQGTSGQFLKSNGPGAAVSWGTASGSGDAVLAATQTFTGQNNWTTPAISTFSFGLAVGSLTITGSGTTGASWQAKQGTGPSSTPQTGYSTMWADSSSGTLVFVDGTSVATTTVVGTTSTITVGNFVKYGALGKLIDGGSSSGGTPGGSSPQWQYNQSGSFAGVAPVTINQASITLSSTHTIVLASATAGGSTYTLPAASNTGQILQITKVDATTNTITVVSAGTDLIAGTTATLILNAIGQTDEITAGASGWWPHGQGLQVTPARISLPNMTESNGFQVGSSSSMLAIPIQIPVPVAVTGFAWAAGAANTVAFGINDRNGNVLVSTNGIVQAGSGTLQATFTPKNLPPGQYYVTVLIKETTANTMDGGSNNNSGGILGCSIQQFGGATTIQSFTPPMAAVCSSVPAVQVLVSGGNSQTFK